MGLFVKLMTIHNSAGHYSYFFNFIFTFSNNDQHQNILTFFFTFYITSIIFYYYSNKKNSLQYKTFLFFYTNSFYFISHHHFLLILKLTHYSVLFFAKQAQYLTLIRFITYHCELSYPKRAIKSHLT
jgi:hypothetical protein